MRLAPLLIALALAPALGCADKPPADVRTPGAADGGTAQGDCPPPDADCMNADNHAQCLEMAKACPGKVVQLESCPLQFSCG